MTLTNKEEILEAFEKVSKTVDKFDLKQLNHLISKSNLRDIDRKAFTRTMMFLGRALDTIDETRCHGNIQYAFEEIEPYLK